MRLLADTGNPFAIIIGETTMERLRRRAASDVDTNFGILKGFWLRLNMPELGLEQELLAYASDAVAEAAETSDRAFEGLAGLPFLRLLEFGGDADSFWLRATTH
ncbi:MAG TPA: hypothetical protein VFI31_18985 [Pirellulales bacterium]|nr:hypothetical protein [Pirellulales bacterium]